MNRRTTATGGRMSCRCTALVLTVIGALHLGWAAGSTFPFRTRDALNDAVVGRPATPGPAECGAVAGLLAVAAAVVVAADRGRTWWARLASVGVASVLSTRAAFGFAGRTSVLVPGSESPRFKRLDRFVYSPLCTLLAVGAGAAAR